MSVAARLASGAAGPVGVPFGSATRPELAPRGAVDSPGPHAVARAAVVSGVLVTKSGSTGVRFSKAERGDPSGAHAHRRDVAGGATEDTTPGPQRYRIRSAAIGFQPLSSRTTGAAASLGARRWPGQARDGGGIIGATPTPSPAAYAGVPGAFE